MTRRDIINKNMQNAKDWRDRLNRDIAAYENDKAVSIANIDQRIAECSKELEEANTMLGILEKALEETA